MRVHVQERQRDETGGREEALAALPRANLSFMLHDAVRCDTALHCSYGHGQGEEQGSCDRVGRAAGGSGDLRHDGNDDEHGDREDEHDQRPGCGKPNRETPSS